MTGVDLAWDSPPLFVDIMETAGDQQDPFVALELIHLTHDLFRMPQIVTIKKGYKFCFGISDADIARIRKPAMGSTDHLHARLGPKSLLYNRR